ncbi:hypothetical protein NE237_011171 [Protea cynaroides]|uniref:Pentatricopeptide repeat-containing protein n=1 Tax=Protea cynaroides TaxID=273540 RepID=A0A9Q0GV60_9MAGN|nr:hypothetical protein NE237_011171 [Protea cynaroides]
MNLPFPPIQSNHFVHSIVARACGSSAGHYLLLGKCVRACVIKSGFVPNVVVETAFLGIYAKSGFIELSRKVFDEMPQRNSISWNAMIAGYARNGMEALGLQLFYQMKCMDCQIQDEFAVSTALAACAGINGLNFGMQVHAFLLTVVLSQNVLIHSVICTFDVVRSLALRRYNDAITRVVQDSNFIEIAAIDHSVVVFVLTACAKLSLLRVGKQVHGLIITLLGSHLNWVSDEEDVAIIGSALIDMYCKCSSVREARQVFDWLHPTRHISHWNAMITSYIHAGLLEDAKECFREMPERDLISWTTMISGNVQHRLPQHGLTLLAKMYTNEDGLMLEALINMYSKSGLLNYAQRVFDQILEKNVISWTSMITGYAIHGIGSQALEIFQQMLETGVKPNEVTFVSVLIACNHCGFVQEGMRYFKLMKDKYGILPRADHYTCVIDLLGRAGRLTEARSLLEEIADEDISDASSSETIWGAFLGACRLHGDVEIGIRVAKKMLEKKQEVSSTCITLSNFYAAVGMWDEAYKSFLHLSRDSRTEFQRDFGGAMAAMLILRVLSLFFRDEEDIVGPILTHFGVKLKLWCGEIEGVFEFLSCHTQANKRSDEDGDCLVLFQKYRLHTCRVPVTAAIANQSVVESGGLWMPQD